MKANSFFALLTGLAAGAVMGVLMAPAKGEESRRKVKDAAGKALDSVKKAILPEELEMDETDEEGAEETEGPKAGNE